MVLRREKRFLIPPSQPTLASSTVHVWTLGLTGLRSVLPKPRELLSTDEVERWGRFRFEEDRERFAATREALRILLGGYAEADPRALIFGYTREGKPSIAQPATDIRFNVSHSHDYAVVAVAREIEVGVDLELRRGDAEIEGLAERFFSGYERERLRETPASVRAEVFYQIWTGKEALIKATGIGLSLSLSSFDVGMESGSGLRLVAMRPNAEESRRWYLQSLSAPGGYAAALATEGETCPPVMLKW